jgi:hypothetical protein
MQYQFRRLPKASSAGEKPLRMNIPLAIILFSLFFALLQALNGGEATDNF